MPPELARHQHQVGLGVDCMMAIGKPAIVAEQQRISAMVPALQSIASAALMGLENWTFDFSRFHNELLAKQGVLRQQLGPRASDVSNKTGEHGKGTRRFPNRCLNSIE